MDWGGAGGPWILREILRDLHIERGAIFISFNIIRKIRESIGLPERF